MNQTHSVKYVPCPQCRRKSEFSPANPHRPFCSHRCQQIDLGAWHDESYAIPSAVAREELVHQTLHNEPSYN